MTHPHYWKEGIPHNRNMMRMWQAISPTIPYMDDVILAEIIERTSAKFLLAFSDVLDHAKSLIESSDDKRAGHTAALKFLGLISSQKKPEIPEDEVFFLYLVLIGKILYHPDDLPHLFPDVFEVGVEKDIMTKQAAIDFLAKKYESASYQSMYDRLKGILKKLRSGKYPELDMAIKRYRPDLTKVLPPNWPKT
jgi:hypothetical protein